MDMDPFKTCVRSITLVSFACTGWAWAQNAPASLSNQIQKALNAAPGYGVFDFLTFKADGGKVTLLGQATTADLKNQAEIAVRGLPGVSAVENSIAVSPLSKDDAAVGKAVSNAVYGGTSPSIYAKQHSIHILVKNAEVTLEGTVNSDIDRTMIGSAAVGAGNVFSVTNHLVAASPDSADAQWRQDMAGGPPPPPVVITPSVSPNADK
jgi:osmotically-inducible protein OsmY